MWLKSIAFTIMKNYPLVVSFYSVLWWSDSYNCHAWNREEKWVFLWRICSHASEMGMMSSGSVSLKMFRICVHICHDKEETCPRSFRRCFTEKAESDWLLMNLFHANFKVSSLSHFKVMTAVLEAQRVIQDAVGIINLCKFPHVVGPLEMWKNKTFVVCL